MIRRNRRGEIIESRRHLDTRVSAELLVGDGWQAIAHTELRKLTLIIGMYQKQLENHPGYEELSRAVVALDSACESISESVKRMGDEP